MRGLWIIALLLASCRGSDDSRAVPSGVATARSQPQAPSASATASAPAAVSSTAPSAQGAAPRRARDVPAKNPAELVASPPSPSAGTRYAPHGAVDPGLDGAWLARLASAPVASVRLNGGGTSLTLRITFRDGRRAVFKPAQSLSSSNHRAEIAAYHLDRLLGFGRTAPVAGRRFPLAYLESELSADAPTLERLRSEGRPSNGQIEGAMIGWHDGPLADASPGAGFRDRLSRPASPSERLTTQSAELVDLLLFDFLIDNTDRFSGGNIQSVGRGGPLVFLDNASAFLPGRARSNATLRTLDGVCQFPRRTVEAVQAAATAPLSETLGASLARDPLAPVLEVGVLRALDGRAKALLQRVETCRSEHGDGVLFDAI